MQVPTTILAQSLDEIPETSAPLLDQRGPDLTEESALLDALREATPAEAEHLDRQLRALWEKSGSPAMDLLLRRGRDALEEGDYDVAIEHLTALTDHAPDFAEGWQVRAAAYYRAELFGPALADLERALALNPNHYHAMLGLGAILETVGLDQLAFEAYSQAISIHPHHEDVSSALDRLRRSVEGTDL
nr:tetratricopeptide repeat protein [Chachezhania antarctica]